MEFSLLNRANDILATMFPGNAVSVRVDITNLPSRVEITYPTGAKEVCYTKDAIFRMASREFYFNNIFELYHIWGIISRELTQLTCDKIRQLNKMHI